MDKVEFEARLKKAYNGTVQPLNSYVNKRATLVFKCHSCGLVFFGKPCHVVGKEHQRHECNMPNGDIYGERLSYVSGTKTHKKKSTIFTGEQFSKMVWEDYTPKEMAKELKIPVAFVKEYFEAEGLI